MRLLAAIAVASLPTVATPIPNPVAMPTKLDPAGQARARALLQELVEIPSVKGRDEVPKVANAVAAELRAAGIAESDIRIIPYEGLPGDQTAALIARWRAPHATRKPLLLIGHMDVVDAKREDWKYDPFKLREQDGYFYGRGSWDMKGPIAAIVMAITKLKQAGFTPDRDIILFLSGDEETMQNGATFATTKWRDLVDADVGLSGDGGHGYYDRSGRLLGYGLGAAEKVYQTYFFTTRNPGGHSGNPRPDNAIYELADALKKVQGYRFEPQLIPTTRAYFAERQKDEKGALGDAMRRWLANEKDGEAADIIEASPTEVGLTRTRCVATMLSAGHADNALPQSATATINCRMMPGTSPPDVQAELQRLVGPKVEVKPDPSFAGKPTPVLPIREDVRKAYTDAVRKMHGPDVRITPKMDTGASDSSFFRAAGIPVFDVDGLWGIDPDDQRLHGLDERVPVRALYDDVLHWETMIKTLAGR